MVPDGKWIAVTTAPATGCFCGSFTIPVTEPVVTPWALARVAAMMAWPAATANVRKTVVFIEPLSISCSLYCAI